MNISVTKIWNNEWALSLIAGLLLGLSFPPFPFPFLIIPAFILILRLTDISPTAKNAVYKIYPGFVLWNIIGTYWLCLATFWGGVAAILANSVVMTLPVFLIFYFQKKKINFFLSSLGIAAAWTTYEFLHHHWDLAWPWLSFTNAFSSTPLIIQYISFTGPLAVTFLAVFISALIYEYIQKHEKSILISIWILVLVPILFSVIKYYSTPLTSPHKMQVLVIQPNYDSYQELSGYSNAYTPLRHILAYSDSMKTDSTDLILWPENAIQIGITKYSPIVRMISNKSAIWHTTIISGANLFYYYSNGPHPEVVRKTSSGEPYNVFNAALGFGPNGQVSFYKKAKLVPIVERVPFVNFLNDVNIFKLNWGNLAGYGRGDKVKDFNTRAGRITALVCYDQDFPNWVRQFVKKGSDIIAVITNDGWWGNSSGYYQHFEYARLRAIENDRYVVRCANNGISAVIAPNGKVMRRTQYWKRTAFRYDVPIFKKMTFYTKNGDWFGYLSEILTVLMLAFSVYFSRKNI